MIAHSFDVAIAGEINLDLILYGLPEQMALDRELLASGFEMTLGSSSAILAHNLSVLGTRVGFVTCTGEDDSGRIALDRLAESGVDVSRSIQTAGVATGVTILLPHGNTRHILTHLGAMAAMRVEDLDLQYLCSARHFHLSSLYLQKAMQPDLPHLFKELKKAGLTISLDTNDDPEDEWSTALEPLLDLIDILLPNQDELMRIAGKTTLEEALDTFAPRVPLIVVKCGSAGALVQQGSHREEIAPLLVEPVDTIGAGDSFNAGFLHAWLRGESATSAAAYGNITGALSTLRPGGTEAFRDCIFKARFLKQHTAQQGIATSGVA